MFKFNIKRLLLVLAVCAAVLSLYVYLVRNPTYSSVASGMATDWTNVGDGTATVYDWTEVSTGGSGRLLVFRCRNGSNGQRSPPPPGDWYQIEGRVVRFRKGATTVPLHSCRVVRVGGGGGVEIAEIVPQHEYRKLMSSMSRVEAIDSFLTGLENRGD